VVEGSKILNTRNYFEHCELSTVKESKPPINFKQVLLVLAVVAGVVTLSVRYPDLAISLIMWFFKQSA
jgi:hypothetical protein